MMLIDALGLTRHVHAYLVKSWTGSCRPGRSARRELGVLLQTDDPAKYLVSRYGVPAHLPGVVMGYAGCSVLLRASGQGHNSTKKDDAVASI